MSDAARSLYHKQYGASPAVLVAAPGRVNLIGEHIDYEGYGVLPMALQQACYIAAGPAEGLSISIASSNPELYPTAVIDLCQVAESLTSGPHSWQKYVLAAVQDVLAKMEQQGRKGPATGLQLMVHGTIPPGAGLSSSSALVVASAVAAMTLWGVPGDRMQIAALAASCERHVGTQGGGMDQAISLLAQPGLAMKVDFNPVRAAPVQLPPDAAFVVAHSLSSSFKADTAASRFNRRVVECRLAAMLLAKHLNPQSNAWVNVRTLQQVQADVLLYSRQAHQQRGGSAPIATGAEAEQADILQDPEAALVAAAANGNLQKCLEWLLPQRAYTIPQLEELLGRPLLQLFQDSPAGQLVLQAESAPAAAAAGGSHQAAAAEAASCPNSGFQLQQRARHVYTEAARVLQFQQVCADKTLAPAQQLQQLGDLMSASHASCRDDYQCSCRELDQLVAAAAGGGALGARLTGAGWGGCIVALLPHAQVQAFQDDMRQHYYSKAVRGGLLHSLNDVDDGGYMFATQPGAGASVTVSQGYMAPWDAV